jgi:hypothetical protein
MPTDLWQHSHTIMAGTPPFLYIDLGKDEPGMTLQFRDVKSGYIVWRDYKVNSETVTSSVDIDALTPGVYRLV